MVCGTDTDVGKTVVSAWLVQGLQALYWKPVQSGLEDGGDRGRVSDLLQLAADRFLPEAYAFQQPFPHWAAELDGVTLDGGTWLPPVDGALVVENRRRPDGAAHASTGCRSTSCSNGSVRLCWWRAADSAPSTTPREPGGPRPVAS